MEPASIRYKNPGAMWGSALAIKWGASPKAVVLNDGKGQGNNIAVFPTYVQGICAQLDLWRTSKNYKNKRFSDAIAIWSGGNNVESYIQFVLARVPGMTRNTVMDDAFWRSSMPASTLLKRKPPWPPHSRNDWPAWKPSWKLFRMALWRSNPFSAKNPCRFANEVHRASDPSRSSAMVLPKTASGMTNSRTVSG